jgi:hypothetical protein
MMESVLGKTSSNASTLKVKYITTLKLSGIIHSAHARLKKLFHLTALRRLGFQWRHYTDNI